MGRPSVRKNPLLKRYWIEFPRELTQHGTLWLPAAVGVTAYSLGDALDIIHQHLNHYLRLSHEQHLPPPVVRFTEDVDISALADKHGRPLATGISVWRGIWYPYIWYWAWLAPQF